MWLYVLLKKKLMVILLGIEDYKIEDEKLKYRVDLAYMYKKIAGKDIDPEKLEELKNKLKRYRSINSKIMHHIELTDEEYHTFQNCKVDEKSTNSFSLENANKKISELETEKRDFENKNKELVNKNEVLEKEKKEFVNKNEVLETENKQKDLKILELMKKLNEYENKEKQNQQEQQNQQEEQEQKEGQDSNEKLP